MSDCRPPPPNICSKKPPFFVPRTCAIASGGNDWRLGRVGNVGIVPGDGSRIPPPPPPRTEGAEEACTGGGGGWDVVGAGAAGALSKTSSGASLLPSVCCSEPSARIV